MTGTKKPNLVRPQSPGWTGLYKVAIAGAASLKGKEVKEVLDERNFPAHEVLLLDDDESLGQLETVGEEATFIQNVARDSFEKVDLAFFAGDEAFTRKHWQAAKSAGCAIVDLSYALETESNIGIRAPWLEKELESQVERAAKLDLETTAVAVAHPAAVMLGLLLLRAQRSGAVRNAIVTLFEPVSEQGKRGMDELHQQTLNLLSFQSMPKEVFDVQVAFNMLPRFGDESKVSLQASAERIARHLKLITRSRIELPALQVIHAPTFHGHTASIFLELDRKISAEDFSLALKGEHVSIITAADDAPSNVNAAGQDQIMVSLSADPVREKGLWLWAASDNLKISAITAIECAAALVATRPSGKIQ
ncbi:MAG: aspartate semialdehyde dehydrogenase [Candidatus Angelobacter sp.]|nr:aspartate semialdehyde dehydrogenase [Candidatus Angelobacter sp.]